jgi:glycosyltransferase involved in cell wall biosynthesis
MWPETLEATGMVKNRRILRLVDAAAKWGYSKAAAVRVITPGFRDNLIEKGVPEEKIHVISNWVDTERYHPLEPDGVLGAELGFKNRFTVMYAGTIGLAQGLETILKAATLLKDLPSVQFMLVGDGANLDALKAAATEQKLDNVRFLGRVSPGQVSKLYSLADVLLVTLQDAPIFRITIPHKIFAYMASAKPVLVAADGDSADVILNANAGLQCAPGNAEDLAAVVRRFYRMTPNERMTMGQNGRNTVLKYYGREQLVGKIAKMLESVVESQSKTKRNKE